MTKRIQSNAQAQALNKHMDKRDIREARREAESDMEHIAAGNEEGRRYMRFCIKCGTMQWKRGPHANDPKFICEIHEETA